MSLVCSNFLMRLQSQLLEASLPPAGHLERKGRRKFAKELSKAVARICSYLRPDAVLEIGAHEASFSLSMRALLPDARIVAFEANPEIHALYEENLRSAGIEYLKNCVADENRMYNFTIPFHNDVLVQTMGSILNDSRAGEFQKFSVEGVRLDDFLDRQTGVNAMWIDVEGAIGPVLDGAQKSLDRCVALFAEVESTSRWDGQRLANDVIKQLAQHGLFPILRDVQRKDWQYNVLFLREEAFADPFIGQLGARYLTKCARKFLPYQIDAPVG